MAYGFGSTFGTSGTTDRILVETATRPAAYTLMLWTLRNGEGGNNVGRMYDDLSMTLWNDLSGTVYKFERTFAGATSWGTWTVPRPSAGVWHPVIVRHNGSSAANDPLIDFETPQTVTEVSTPSGTIDNPSAVRGLGGRNHATVLTWDGQLAEYAMWNRMLTDGEVAALAQGVAPSFFPNGLTNYRPIIRGTQDRRAGGVAGTVTGALVQPHPRIFYPRRGVVYSIPQPPPAGPPVVEAIGAKAEAGASSAPLVVPLPAGVVANDILLLAVENTWGLNISLSDAQGFAQIGSTLAGAGSGTELAVFWKRAVGGDTAPTLTGTQGGSAHYCAGIARISGCLTTGTPWVDAPVTGGETTANTTLTASGGTTTVDNVMVVVIAAQGTDTDTPQYSDWANASLTAVGEVMDYSTALGLGGGVAMATGLKATAGTVTATTATLATSSTDCFMTLFLAGSGEGEPPPEPGDLAQRRSHSSLGTRIGSRQVQEG